MSASTVATHRDELTEAGREALAALRALEGCGEVLLPTKVTVRLLAASCRLERVLEASA